MFLGLSLVIATICVVIHRAAVFSAGFLFLIGLIACAITFPAVLAVVALPFLVWAAITTPRQP